MDGACAALQPPVHPAPAAAARRRRRASDRGTHASSHAARPRVYHFSTEVAPLGATAVSTMWP